MEQAVEILRTNHGVIVDDGLAPLTLSIAKRQPPRQIVSEHDAEEIDSPAAPPDGNVVSAERDFLEKRVYAALERARHALTPDEWLILKMQFYDDVAVADIARALHLDQPRLYRTSKRLLKTLRKRLEADGLSKDDIHSLFNGSMGDGQ